MKRLAVIAAALSTLLLSGCKLRPEDPIFAYGLLQDADGRPLQDRLQLERSGPHHYEKPRELQVWEPFGEAEAAPDGSFTLELLYGDTSLRLPDGSEQGAVFRLLPASHPSTLLEFWVRDGDVELPPLRVVRPEIASASSDGALLIRRGALPPPVETPASATAIQPPPAADGTPQPNPSPPQAVVELSTRVSPFWRAAMPSEERTFSSEVLEDFDAPVAQVIASAQGWFTFEPLVRQYSSLSFHVFWSSDPVVLAKGARTPVSRGVACEALAEPECPLTDGDLRVVELPEETFVIELELAAEGPLRHAIVRGLRTTLLPSALLLEARDARGTWASLGDFMKSKPHFDPGGAVDLYAELALPPGTRGQRLRLRAVDEQSQPIAFEAIRELSLFE